MLIMCGSTVAFFVYINWRAERDERNRNKPE